MHLHRRRRVYYTRQVRRSHREQYLHALQLMEANFDLLEQHQRHLDPRTLGPVPVRPALEIECRDAIDFESGNWSRFAGIWLIYLAALRSDFLVGNDHIIDLDYETKARGMKTLEEAEDFLGRYRQRIYGIIHSGKPSSLLTIVRLLTPFLGYNIYEDTQFIDPNCPVVIDGRSHTSEIAEGSLDSSYSYDQEEQGWVEHVRSGFYPRDVDLRNSGYLADYCPEVSSCLRRWQDEGAIINHRQHPHYAQSLPFGRSRLKLTIEPNKPRICINARPNASVMKRMPCRLDSIEQLICYLTPGTQAIISDDKQGFFHVMLDHRCRGLMQFHFGDEVYSFTCMAFGISSAPSVYQGCNNVLSSLMRQYGIENVLYIGKTLPRTSYRPSSKTKTFVDDRCVLTHGPSDYICWLITSLSTSTGHFLSLNKSHLNTARDVFVYLGIEFDVPAQKVRIPLVRKVKIRDLLTVLLADLDHIPFHSLEKLRGMLVSILLVCPLSALYIREMNRVLAAAEEQLQEVIKGNISW